MPNEGEISFDIRFYIITQKGERIKLIINIELHGLLGTVFSDKLIPERKINILNNEYGMKTAREAEKGKEISLIADELEEKEELILPIYEAVLKAAHIITAYRCTRRYVGNKNDVSERLVRHRNDRNKGVLTA